jgi:urea transport system ATP-binding protein
LLSGGLALSRRGGLSVLLVEQHVGFALSSATTYYVMESGRVTGTGEGGSASTDAVRAAMAF